MYAGAHVCVRACVCVPEEICLETPTLTKDVPSSHLYAQSSNIKVFVTCKYFYSFPSISSLSSSNPAQRSADARGPL